MICDWILNLDADLELEDPSHHPSPRLAARVRAMSARFLELATAHSDGVLHRPLTAAARGDALQAFCPTTRARELAHDAGRELGGPPIDVLATCNHRAFAVSLQARHNPCATVFVDTEADALRVIEGPWPQHGFLLKRPFGFSGRGRKHLTSPPGDAQHRWIEASMHDYGRGLCIEPFADIETEFGLHGWLRADAEVMLGEPTLLRCDARGAWQSTEPAGDALRPDEETLLRAAALDCAAALHTAHYFGPFSIDAYRARGGFHALSEVNARYSMGWFVGMASRVRSWCAFVSC